VVVVTQGGERYVCIPALHTTRLEELLPLQGLPLHDDGLLLTDMHHIEKH
jgi:hypothetical protein